MLLAVASFEISLGPITWLLMSEIFPTRIRGRAMAFASFFLWVSSFGANLAFPPVLAHFEENFGTPAGAFWIYAMICLGAFVLGWRKVPETRGRSLEEIGKSWLQE